MINTQALPKFMLIPFRDSYNFTLANNVVTTELEDGMPRQRVNSVGKPHRITATYKCTRAKQQYLRAFVRAYQAQPFLAFLILEDIDHDWYKCRIVNQSFNINAKSDQIFTNQLQLVCEPTKPNPELDKTIVEIYNMTDGDYQALTNPLEKLVNENLPSAMRGI